MKNIDEIDLCKDYELLKGNLIKIYNPETKHFTMTRSIFDIPEGYKIVERKPFSDETRKKMSESAKKRGTPDCAYRSKKGKNNPMFGKKHSKETRQKISQTMKGKD